MGMADDAELYKAQEVFFETIREKGADEEKTKKALMRKTSASKRDAMMECNDAHQSLAKCVTRGVTPVQDEYRLLDFAARKQVLTSINEDCRFNRGVCLSARTGDPVCIELESPKSADTSATTADDAEGEKGKKKKKKK